MRPRPACTCGWRSSSLPARPTAPAGGPADSGAVTPQATLRWTDWTWDPLITAGLAATVLVYLWAARRFPPRGRQAGWLWAGVATLALALLSPIDVGAEYLFSVHMLQHMLLMLVAAPFLALSVPPGLLGWAYGRPGLRRVLRAVWAPAPAFVLFNGILLVWHLPAAYDATLRLGWLHAAEHITFLAAGVVFWGVIVSPAPALVRAPLPARLVLLVAADVVNFMLGFALAFAGRPFYTAYALVPRLWGLTPIQDLHLGGAVMWVMGQMMYAVPVLILLWVLLRRDVERGPSWREERYF